LDRWPKPATERQILDNLIDAALRTQGIVSMIPFGTRVATWSAR